MFSLAPRGLDESDSRSDGSANVNRKKLLMIGATTVGVILVAIGGLIWYNSGSPTDPVPATNTTHNAGGGGGVGSGVKVDVGGGGIEFGGGSIGGQPINSPPSPPQASPILDRLMTVAKTHAMLTVGVLIGVFLLITAIVALVVYQTTSNQEFIDGNVGVENGVTALDGRKVDAIKEEDEAVPVLPIILAVVAAVVLIIAGLTWRAYRKQPEVQARNLQTGEQPEEQPKKNHEGQPDKQLEEPSVKLQLPSLPKANTDERTLLQTLIEYRDEMSDESKCVLDNGGDPPKYKPHLVPVKYGSMMRSVYCPENFTPNAVWWAIDEKFRKYGIYALPYEGRMQLFSVPSGNERALPIWLQYHPLRNIPGHDDGIPHYPQPADNEDDVFRAFDEEYEAWKHWALKDNDCEVSEGLDMKDAVNFHFFEEKPLSIQCKAATPTIRSVFAAVSRFLPSDSTKFRVIFGDDSEFFGIKIHGNEDSYKVSDLRELLWGMYEAFSPMRLPRTYFEKYYR